MSKIKESFIFPLYNFIIFLWIHKVKTGTKSISKNLILMAISSIVVTMPMRSKAHIEN